MNKAFRPALKRLHRKELDLNDRVIKHVHHFMPVECPILKTDDHTFRASVGFIRGYTVGNGLANCLHLILGQQLLDPFEV